MPASAPLVAPAAPAASSAAPVAATGSTRGWQFPFAALGGCVLCGCGELAIWSPLVLPVALLAIYGANQGTGLAAALLVIATGLWAMPASLFNAALAPLVIAGGSLLDSAIGRRTWWPAAIGAAAGWVAMAAVFMAAGTVYVVNAARSSFFSIGMIGQWWDPFAWGVLLVGLPLAIPLALVGSVAADLLIQPDAEDAPAAVGPSTSAGVE